MIFSRAYFGALPVRRIYCNGRLLWNYGTDIRGALIIHLNATALPHAEPTCSVFLADTINGQLLGSGRAQRLLSYIGALPICLENIGFGRICPAVRPSGLVFGSVSAFAPGYSYGLVFSRGDSRWLLTQQASGRPAGCRYPLGLSMAKFPGLSIPKQQAMVNLVHRVRLTSISGSVHCRFQEGDPIHGSALGTAPTLAAPSMQWAQWLNPIRNGAVLHIRMVRNAVQHDHVLTIS